MNKNILLGILIIMGVFVYMNYFGNKSASANEVGAVEAKSLSEQQGYFLLDVRTKEEFASFRAERAINIPLHEIEARLAEIPKDQELLVVCRSGHRSQQAISILKKHGYEKTHNVDGGMMSWPKESIIK